VSRGELDGFAVGLVRPFVALAVEVLDAVPASLHVDVADHLLRLHLRLELHPFAAARTLRRAACFNRPDDCPAPPLDRLGRHRCRHVYLSTATGPNVSRVFSVGARRWPLAQTLARTLDSADPAPIASELDGPGHQLTPLVLVGTRRHEVSDPLLD